MSDEKTYIPLSKLNTFVFCPRRFFYEFIEGEERSNEFIEDGAIKHETVNEAADRLQRGERTVSRQVYVASETLGISGYMEVLEEVNGVLRPIEYKRGHVGDWFNDKVQLCAAMLCLEEMRGVSIASGDLFYIGSHRRKEVVFDEALRQVTKDIIAQAHALVKNPQIPPPVNDARCNGCSVKSICLPSEVALLLSRQSAGSGDRLPVSSDQLPASSDQLPVSSDQSAVSSDQSAGSREPSTLPRHANAGRILPSLGMERVLYVDTQGAYIRKVDERLVVAQRDKEGQEEVLRDFPIINLDQVVVAGNVGFTTPAARFLLQQGVPLVFLSSRGTYEGTLMPEISKNSLLRLAQHQALAEEGRVLHLARRFVGAKLANYRAVLMRYNRGLQSEAVETSIKRLYWRLREVERAESLEQLLGVEGNGSSDYFRVLGELIKADLGFAFEGRNRRPPRDPVNALLSFAYALLTKDMISTICLVGLDPYVGFYHQAKYGRPSLALDMMEEFRPIVADSVVLTFLNNEMVHPPDFETREGGVFLSEAARKKFYRVYEMRKNDHITHPTFGYRLPYRRAMELQVRILAKFLTGEIDDYYPLVVR
ncbi:MAG: CRISPR-associated endonuclease Cas1 [Abditibacteriales bacterium]|nr:CRISPR-associated endonuclease Cas1 [Abditibacteriales bacterium]